ncbi:hypothetical protein IJ182_00610 [bacterium]|nr:hypothetical protein [bacterium]
MTRKEIESAKNEAKEIIKKAQNFSHFLFWNNDYYVSALNRRLLSDYYSEVRKKIEENTNNFSVFHYEETKFLDEQNGISFWSLRKIGTKETGVINSNMEIVIPFKNYGYIEKYKEFILVSENNQHLLFDYNGKFIKKEEK